MELTYACTHKGVLVLSACHCLLALLVCVMNVPKLSS